MFTQIWQRVIHFALPTTCTGCGDLLSIGEPVGVCPTCWKALPFWRLDLEPAPHLPKAVDAFHAPFLYEDPVRGWILSTKFADRTELAAMQAAFMRRFVPIEENVLLVPVPVHSSRLRWRLYNHAALLTQALARQSGAPWAAQALKRVRKTVPQVKKTRRQRQLLPVSAFKAEEQQVKGRHIVLVDDIWTTGATAKACAAALKKAGAARVTVLTVAYVAP